MFRSRSAVAIALPLFVMALAGCSATADDTPETKSDSQIAAEAKAWDLENATCLREAGVNAGDPSGDSQGVEIDLGKGMDMDTIAAASEKCMKSTTEKLGERPVTPADKKQAEEFEKKRLESNKCLRGKGYDVLDPKEESGGGVSISADGTANVPQDVLEECGALGGMATTESQ